MGHFLCLSGQPAQPAQPAESRIPPDGPFVHPARAVRVLLLRDTDRFEFAVSSHFRVVDEAGKDLVGAIPPLERTPVLIQRHSPTAMILGRNRFAAKSLDLVPERSGSLSLLMPAGAQRQVMRRLPGFLRCVLKPDGLADVINVVDVEDYLGSVLRGEVPPNWHPEAYKAHAIAARTYVLYEKNTVGRRRNWDVTATARSQMYIGLDPQSDETKAAQAVRDTRGIVCTWRFPDGDRIFCAYYSAVCGGFTQDASLVNNDPSIPPLAGRVRCDYCAQAPKGTYRWAPVSFLLAEIGKAMRARYQAARKLESLARIEVARVGFDGRALAIRLIDQTGSSTELSAEAFRLTVDPTGMTLKSTHFQLVQRDRTILFTHGRGWGHGLGMCQWGAQGLARRGKTAEQILSYYYPRSRLTKVYD